MWARRIARGVRAWPRGGRRWRCSMSITRCGSVSSWVSWRIPTSAIAAQLAWEQALAGAARAPRASHRSALSAGCRSPGAWVDVAWPAELQQRVRAVARQCNATTFMVLQAALAVVLAKISASSDVAVGFSIAGRRDPALDELVGFFVNTLVLRVDVAGDPTVAELLTQCNSAAWPLLSIKTCPSRSSWNGSTPPDP